APQPNQFPHISRKPAQVPAPNQFPHIAPARPAPSVPVTAPKPVLPQAIRLPSGQYLVLPSARTTVPATTATPLPAATISRWLTSLAATDKTTFAAVVLEAGIPLTVTAEGVVATTPANVVATAQTSPAAMSRLAVIRATPAYQTGAPAIVMGTGTPDQTRAVDPGAPQAAAPPAAAPEELPLCACFPAGTKVATRRGLVPIQDVRVGDELWARSVSADRTELRRVTALFRHPAARMLTLDVADLRVQATPDHPFWVTGRGWVQAGQLRPGERLLRRNGTSALLEGVAERKVHTVVYNLSVAGDHDFYISPAQLLVHNCTPTRSLRFQVITGGGNSAGTPTGPPQLKVITGGRALDGQPVAQPPVSEKVPVVDGAQPVSGEVVPPVNEPAIRPVIADLSVPAGADLTASQRFAQSLRGLGSRLQGTVSNFLNDPVNAAFLAIELGRQFSQSTRIDASIERALPDVRAIRQSWPGGQAGGGPASPGPGQAISSTEAMVFAEYLAIAVKAGLTAKTVNMNTPDLAFAFNTPSSSDGLYHYLVTQQLLGDPAAVSLLTCLKPGSSCSAAQRAADAQALQDKANAAYVSAVADLVRQYGEQRLLGNSDQVRVDSGVIGPNGIVVPGSSQDHTLSPDLVSFYQNLPQSVRDQAKKLIQQQDAARQQYVGYLTSWGVPQGIINAIMKGDANAQQQAQSIVQANQAQRQAPYIQAQQALAGAAGNLSFNPLSGDPTATARQFSAQLAKNLPPGITLASDGIHFVATSNDPDIIQVATQMNQAVDGVSGQLQGSKAGTGAAITVFQQAGYNVAQDSNGNVYIIGQLPPGVTLDQVTSYIHNNPKSGSGIYVIGTPLNGSSPGQVAQQFSDTAATAAKQAADQANAKQQQAVLAGLNDALASNPQRPGETTDQYIARVMAGVTNTTVTAGSGMPPTFAPGDGQTILPGPGHLSGQQALSLIIARQKGVTYDATYPSVTGTRATLNAATASQQAAADQLNHDQAYLDALLRSPGASPGQIHDAQAAVAKDQQNLSSATSDTIAAGFSSHAQTEHADAQQDDKAVAAAQGNLATDKAYLNELLSSNYATPADIQAAKDRVTADQENVTKAQMGLSPDSLANSVVPGGNGPVGQCTTQADCTFSGGIAAAPKSGTGGYCFDGTHCVDANGAAYLNGPSPSPSTGNTGTSSFGSGGNGAAYYGGGSSADFGNTSSTPSANGSGQTGCAGDPSCNGAFTNGTFTNGSSGNSSSGNSSIKSQQAQYQAANDPTSSSYGQTTGGGQASGGTGGPTGPHGGGPQAVVVNGGQNTANGTSASSATYNGPTDKGCPSADTGGGCQYTSNGGNGSGSAANSGSQSPPSDTCNSSPSACTGGSPTDTTSNGGNGGNGNGNGGNGGN
ncbi:MAG: hypothetical protein JO242_04975, partial [Streptosporangiaceae bacterium]|nr:hypothetical protein [Streptosporangiaceae bacterium]